MEGLTVPTPGRVVIAEDNREYRRVLAEVLRRKRYDVVEAPDGRQLIAYLAACEPYGRLVRPDVIVSDVRMPGYSGLAIARGLAESSYRIPVILMTAFADDTLRTHAHRLGVFAVLDKPFDMQALIQVVARARYHGNPIH